MSTVSSATSATTGMFVQLKSFCSALDHDTKKLKQALDNKSSDCTTAILTESSEEYVESLTSDVNDLYQRMNSIEDMLLGPSDTRLSQVNMMELLQKIQHVYYSNETVITSTRDYISKFSDKASSIHNTQNQNTHNTVTMISKAKVSFAAADDDNDENQENICNQSSSAILNSTSIDAINMEINQVQSIPLKERVVLGEIQISSSHHPATAASSSGADSKDGSFDIIEYQEDCNSVSFSADVASTGNNYEYRSPLSNQANSNADESMVEAAIPKTPTIADWNLSNATRHLVKSNAHLVSDGRRKSLIGITDFMSPLPSDTDNITGTDGSSFKYTSSSSKAVLTGRKSISYCASTAGVHQSYSTPQQLLRSCHLLSEDSKVHVEGKSMPLTPVTPTIGTPFQTCDLRTNVINRSDAYADIADISYSPAVTGAVNCSSSSSTINRTTVSPLQISSVDPKQYQYSSDRLDYDSDSDAVAVTDLASSPPKTAILPRPSSYNSSSSSSSSSSRKDILKLSSDEYASMPVFLQLQISLEKINEGVDLINQYINSSNSSINDCLTHDEIDTVIGRENAKATMLGLVTKKRLDIGFSDNKTKQYIIR